MNRTLSRSGFTLTEVLVALFITSIGLMAILTLFPLGGFQMASAIKDDRCGHAAATAAAVARMLYKEACSVPDSAGRAGYPEFGEAAFMAMCCPWDHFPVCRETRFPSNGNTPPNTAAGPGLWVPNAAGSDMLLTTQGHPSTTIPTVAQFPATAFPGMTQGVFELNQTGFKVLIDPIGWENWGNFPSTAATGFKGQRFRWWAGGEPNGLARRSIQSMEVRQDPGPQWTISPTSVTPGRIRSCALSNDLVFNPDGRAKPTIPGGFTLEGASNRFSYAWMFRRPQGKHRDTLSMTVLVFDGRQLDLPTEEFVYYWGFPDQVNTPTRIRLNRYGLFDSIVYNPGTRTPPYPMLPAPLPVPDRSPWPPPIKRGGWILDISITSPDNASADRLVFPAACNFYRVLSSEQVSADSLDLELDKQPTLPNNPRTTPPDIEGRVVRKLVIFDKLAEVFEKGTITRVVPPR